MKYKDEKVWGLRLTPETFKHLTEKMVKEEQIEGFPITRMAEGLNKVGLTCDFSLCRNQYVVGMKPDLMDNEETLLEFKERISKLLYDFCGMESDPYWVEYLTVKEAIFE